MPQHPYSWERGVPLPGPHVAAEAGFESRALSSYVPDKHSAEGRTCELLKAVLKQFPARNILGTSTSGRSWN